MAEIAKLVSPAKKFAEILNEEQHHRNILEVKLIRTGEAKDNGDIVKAKTLTEVDLSEFFFDILQLKMEDCLGLALRTHRYDTKEIKIKRWVDPTPYLTVTPKISWSSGWTECLTQTQFLS